MRMVRPKLPKLLSFIEGKGLDGAVVMGTSNVQYFTGFRGGGAILVASKDGATLLVPQLEYGKASVDAVDVDVRPYYRYPVPGISMPGLIQGSWLDAVSRVVEEYRLSKVGANISSMPYGEAGKLKERLGGRLALDISRDISRMRSVKEGDEVEAMTAAARVAEAGLRAAMDSMAEEVSEVELAGVVEEAMRKAGAEEYSFPTIVAFEENAAYPHTNPTRRRLKGGEVVLIDLGARLHGYCSDITRTIAFGQLPGRSRGIAEAVLEAQLAGIDAVAPGVKAEEPDAAARGVLEKRGMAKYFIHSLGHGVGIDVHEAPRLSRAAEEELEPGMVVTVEPGVYVAGAVGVRIEDMVLVTRKGRRLLTSFERNLF